MGMGAGQSGPGGEGTGPGGMGSVKAPEPNKGKGPRPRAKGKSTKDEETGREFEGDDEGVVGTPLVGRPSRISMEHAAYLRTYDVFPSPLPESCWPPGRIANTFLLEVCVTERGEVNEVLVRAQLGHRRRCHPLAHHQDLALSPARRDGDSAPVLPPDPDRLQA